MVNDLTIQRSSPRSEVLARFLAQRQPVQARNNTQAAAQAVGQIAQAFLVQRALHKDQQREKNINETLSRALADKVTPQNPGDFGPVQPRPATQDDLIRTLSANPDTARTALSLRLQQLQKRADEQRQIGQENRHQSQLIAAENRQFDRQKELIKFRNQNKPAPQEPERVRTLRALRADPELAELEKSSLGPGGGATGELITRLQAEDPTLTTKDALFLIQSGLRRDLRTDHRGNLVPATGALEAREQLISNDASAKEIGKEQGIATNNLRDRQASLPRLEQVVDELSELGKIATFSRLGVAEDFVQRELTGNPGDDAVARTEFIAKIDNEVLPLLRQTFGAAFTVEEGNRLRATLGDPNKSPPEKDAILRSFIENKRAQIPVLQRRTGQEITNQDSSPPTQRLRFDAQGNRL